MQLLTLSRKKNKHITPQLLEIRRVLLLLATTASAAVAEKNKSSLLESAQAFSTPEKRSDYLALYDDNATIYGVPPGNIIMAFGLLFRMFVLNYRT